MSVTRETPTERSSENPTAKPTIESTIPTVSVTEFEALKFKVQNLEAENLVLREELFGEIYTQAHVITSNILSSIPQRLVN